MPEQARFTVNDELLVSDFGGELVMLSVEQSAYFGIQGSGVRIWELLANPVTVAEIGDTIAAEFEVPVDRAHADAAAFCSELKERGLIVERP